MHQYFIDLLSRRPPLPPSPLNTEVLRHQKKTVTNNNKNIYDNISRNKNTNNKTNHNDNNKNKNNNETNNNNTNDNNKNTFIRRCNIIIPYYTLLFLTLTRLPPTHLRSESKTRKAL